MQCLSHASFKGELVVNAGVARSPGSPGYAPSSSRSPSCWSRATPSARAAPPAVAVYASPFAACTTAMNPHETQHRLTYISHSADLDHTRRASASSAARDDEQAFVIPSFTDLMSADN